LICTKEDIPERLLYVKTEIDLYNTLKAAMGQPEQAEQGKDAQDGESRAAGRFI
jgi:hypothetical protein